MNILRYQNIDAILLWFLLTSFFLFIEKSSRAEQMFATTHEQYVEQQTYDILTNWPTASFSTELDRQGNWGLVTNGLQVSIRMLKDRYEPGEPVSAMILVRNVTNKEVEYDNFFGHTSGGTSHLDSKCCTVLAADAIGMPVPRTQPIPLMVDRIIKNSLAPRQQWIYVVRLDRIFDFSQAGDYRVAATLGALTEIEGFTPDNSRAKSDEVLIRMLAKEGASAANSTTVPEKLFAETSGQKTLHLHTSAPAPLLALKPVEGGFSARGKTVLGLIAALLAIIGAVLWRACSREHR